MGAAASLCGGKDAPVHVSEAQPPQAAPPASMSADSYYAGANCYYLMVRPLAACSMQFGLL